MDGFYRVQIVIGRRYLTRKRIRTNRANRRLALSKHMLDDDNLTDEAYYVIYGL